MVTNLAIANELLERKEVFITHQQAQLEEKQAYIEKQQSHIEELTRRLHSTQQQLKALQHQVEQLLKRVYGLSLIPYCKSIPVPVQHLDHGAATIAEYKQRSTQRVCPKLRANQTTKTIKPARWQAGLFLMSQGPLYRYILLTPFTGIMA